MLIFKKMTTHYKKLVIAFLFIPLYGQANNVTSKPTLNISTSQSMPPYVTDNRNGFEDLLAKELYSRLGYSIVIHHIPSERGLKNLNDGVDDGILSRIGGLSEFYPNIIQMNETAVEWRFAAFVKREGIQLKSWADFSPYHVGLVRGWKIFEHNIKHYKSLTKVREASQLFKLLDSDRVDVVVYALRPGLSIINTLGIDGIHVLKPVLANKKKYFYVSKKHKLLIPKADAELRRIKMDGTYDRLFKATVTDKGVE